MSAVESIALGDETQPSGGRPAGHFADRLAAAVAGRESNVVLGLDPDPARLWPAAVERARTVADQHPGPAATAAVAVLYHCRAVLEAVAPAVVAVKPQVACFERLGASGWGVLAAVVEEARRLGLLVLADAKRGDIDVTAAAYAHGLFGGLETPFGHAPGLGVDAATYAPYMGADTIAPMLDGARATGAGVIVLVRTSNPGAADFEDEPLARGGALWERVAEVVDAIGEPGPQSGLSDVGAVLGATAPQHLARARELMPHTPFLLPGIGAQGGRVEDLAPAFAPGPAGGLVTASRSIVRAHEQDGGAPGAAARAAAERLRAAAWALA